MHLTSPPAPRSTTRRRGRPGIAGLALLLTAGLVGGAVPAAAAAPASVAPAAAPAGAELPPLTFVSFTRPRPAVNPRNAGSIVYVRFTLGGDHGLDILRRSWPRSQHVSCATGEPTPGTQWRTRKFGRAGLRYDPETQVYRYAWVTRAEWQNPGLQCRRFELRLADGDRYLLDYRFRAARRVDTRRACADVTDGSGAYISRDPGTDDPLPHPLVSFAFTLAAASCATTSAGVETTYRLVMLAADENGDPLLPHRRIHTRTWTGDGSSSVFIDQHELRGDAPAGVCVFTTVSRDGRQIERAPDRGCDPNPLDADPPGRSGYN